MPVNVALHGGLCATSTKKFRQPPEFFKFLRINDSTHGRQYPRRIVNRDMHHNQAVMVEPAADVGFIVAGDGSIPATGVSPTVNLAPGIIPYNDRLTQYNSKMKIHNLLNGQSTTTDTKATATVRNLIILDASGSMQLIYSQALNGLNETLQTIRQGEIDNPELRQLVSLNTFSSISHKKIYNNIIASQAHDITSDQYRAKGGTPLYDAIGRGIADIEAVKAANDSVLVTIITDGEENCSREFNGPQIKALIEAKRGQGWVFTYIGANQDVEKVAARLSIHHTLNFEASDEGTAEMWNHQNASRRMFYSRLKEKVGNPFASPTADDDDFEF